MRHFVVVVISLGSGSSLIRLLGSVDFMLADRISSLLVSKCDKNLKMSGGEYANGHKQRSSNMSRVRISLHKKLKVKNRRLVEIIKHERLERAALLERVQKQEEATSRSNHEVASLKAQLVTVKAALHQTSLIMEEGFNSFRLAKLRFHELQDGINEDSYNRQAVGQDEDSYNRQAVGQDEDSYNRQAVGQDPEYLQCQPTTSGSASSNLALVVPPPKLQARVNPMFQGVPLMSPSIMLQRLQPDDLERQMSSTPRAVTATTPISPSVHEASVPILTEEGQIRQLDVTQSPGGSYGVQGSSSLWDVSSGAEFDPATTLRRSSRLRRQ